MGKPGEADPCDRPQKFTKGTYKTFNEQATWRPIPAIGQNYPHPPFCLSSTCYPTEPIPSIFLTESARGAPRYMKIRGYATEASHLLLMGIGIWGPMHRSAVKKKNDENSKIFEHSRCSRHRLKDMKADAWPSTQGRFLQEQCQEQHGRANQVKDGLHQVHQRKGAYLAGRN